MTTAAFADSYAILPLADGGVLVDLVAGEYAALNRSAAVVCAALASAPDDEGALAEIQQRLGLPRAEASRAIAGVRASLPLRPSPRAHFGAFSYERVAAGYALHFDGRPRLEVDERGARVTLVDAGASANMRYEYLRAAAPKILFLRGRVVLHGAACSAGGALRAICGASGAGKTTTVRAFGRAGLRVVSEDLIPLASLSPPSVYLDGERRVHAWAREQAQTLDSGGRSADAADLEATLGGESAPLGALWFIAAADRHEQSTPALDVRPLGPTAGAAALMSAVFPGDASPSGWRRYLDVVGALASSVPLFGVRAPKGLERLDEAVRRYAENSAS